MNQAEEDLLVLSAQAGNIQAFNFLFRHYHPPLLRFACKLGSDPELAQEAVQEAWIRIAKTIRRLDDPRAFRSWIYRLVRWRVLDLLKKPRLPVEQLAAESEVAQRPEPDVDPYRFNAVRRGMAQLAEADRTALHLFYLQEMKIQEIAIVLEIPEGTVKSRLNRARNQLKALVEAEGEGRDAQQERFGGPRPGCSSRNGRL